MAGKGKYTTYNAPNSTRKSFLERMFKGDVGHFNPFIGLDHVGGTKAANEAGNLYLRASDEAAGGAIAKKIQKGDIGFFPDGVDISYQGKTSKISAPDKKSGGTKNNPAGGWFKVGDPANPYMPDISSPGPGKTEGTDKLDPKLSVEVFNEKAANDPNGLSVAPRLPGETQNLINPTSAGEKLYVANTLGASSELGKSGV